MIMYKLSFACIILLIILLAEASLQKKHLDDCVYGNECEGNLNCFPDPRDPNSGAKKCLCEFGQIYLPARNNCYPMESTSCHKDVQCQDRDLKRDCNQTSNRCECSISKSPDPSTSKCLNKRNSTCQVNTDCLPTLQCYQRTKTCLCKLSYVWVRSQSKCWPMSDFNDHCVADSDCQDRDQNRVCNATRGSNTLCVCRSGYYSDNHNYCNKQKLFGELCPTRYNRECFSNLFCLRFNNIYQCRCKDSQIWSANQSKCLTMSEFRCQTDSECQSIDQGRVCNATKHCDCKPGYYKDSYGHCFQKLKLGQDCLMQVQCASNNSMCYKTSPQSSFGVCSCRPSHKRSSQVCAQRKCQNEDECGSPSFDEDKNLVCTNKKCGCRQGYAMDLDGGTGKCLKQS